MKQLSTMTRGMVANETPLYKRPIHTDIKYIGHRMTFLNDQHHTPSHLLNTPNDKY